MIECKQSFAESLVSKLQKMNGVQYVHRIVRGPYSILLKIDAKDRQELKDRVEDIMGLGHVGLTTSLIVL
jgi:ppGpp synthetase/RelA/SpoT-type nucleotidyltranferase